jgi:putative transcriptional regulator
MILNKKNHTMSSKLLEIFGFNVEVYEGGPVENDRISFIIKGKPITEKYTPIENEFYLTEDIEEVVSTIIDGKLPIENMKVFWIFWLERSST